MLTLDLHFRGGLGAIAAFAVPLPDLSSLALVECGPASCRQALIDALATHGFSPGQVRHVFLTHIHLDHAGDAGFWAAQGATIHVHPKGARHLVDPSRLAGGARAVYGDQTDALWGPITPVPESKLSILSDGQQVDLGHVRLTALDTPGHAHHHLAYLLGDAIFTGDIAGARLPGHTFLSPTTAPSQFDPDAYASSLARVQALAPARLHLTHFGTFDDPADHLARYADLISTVSQNFLDDLRSGLPESDAIARHLAREQARAAAGSLPSEIFQAYERINPTQLSAQGLALWANKLP